MTGTVLEDHGSVQTGTPFGGVTVWVHGRNDLPCATTDSSGAFTLHGVPADSEVLIAFYGSEFHLPVVRPIRTARTAFQLALATRLLDPTQAPFPESFPLGEAKLLTGGEVTFFVTDAVQVLQFVSSARATIRPEAGCGPYYYSQDGKIVSGATATVGGFGGAFFNLPPGDYILDFETPGQDCTSGDGSHVEFGYPVDGSPASIRFPAVTSMLTQAVGVFCSAR